MKYNTLKAYREILKRDFKLSPATALSYYKAMDALLSDQHILDIKKMSLDGVIARLKAIEHKSMYSKHKNAFLYFCKFTGFEIDKKTHSLLDEMHHDKKKQRRKLKHTNIVEVKGKIDNIRDRKLKLSYETMLNSGLRVSELSQIKRDDCTVSDSKITFDFIGKGQRPERVSITRSRNDRLYNALLGLISDTKDNANLFYSTPYLQKEATPRGFGCHDLRRAFAKGVYRETKSIAKTREALRHKKKRTTKIYLNSKVVI